MHADYSYVYRSDRVQQFTVYSYVELVCSKLITAVDVNMGTKPSKLGMFADEHNIVHRCIQTCTCINALFALTESFCTLKLYLQ